MSPELEDALVIVANGFLVTLYFLAEHAFTLVALATGLIIAWRYDAEVIEQAGGRSRRYGRGGVTVLPRRSPRWRSLAAIGAWALASLLAPTGVEPAIGAALWVAFLIGLIAIPAERPAVLFRHKMMMAGYAGLVLIFRLVLGMNLSAQGALLAVTGQMPGDAGELFSSIKWSVLPYLALVTWAVYPAGFIGLLWQRYQVNRPGTGAMGRDEDVIRRIATRGEGGTHDVPRPPRAGN